MLRACVEDVNVGVLVMECFVQYTASEASSFEHPADKGLELDITVIELVRDWSSQLHLVGLEAERSVRLLSESYVER